MESQLENIQGTYNNNDWWFLLCNLRQRAYYVQSNYLEVMIDGNEERAQWKLEASIKGWISGNTFSKNIIGDNYWNRAPIYGWILSQSLPTHNEYDFWWKERYPNKSLAYNLEMYSHQTHTWKWKYKKNRLNKKQLDESQKKSEHTFH